MNATTVIGYTYDGAVYCSNCAERLAESLNMGAIFCGSEWDSIPCCESCFRLIEDVSLTEDGIAYTIGTLKDDDPESDYQITARDVLRRHGVDPDADSAEEES